MAFTCIHYRLIPEKYLWDKYKRGEILNCSSQMYNYLHVPLKSYLQLFTFSGKTWWEQSPHRGFIFWFVGCIGFWDNTGSVANWIMRLFRRLGEASTPEEVGLWAVSRLCIILYPGICLQLKKNHERNLSQGIKSMPTLGLQPMYVVSEESVGLYSWSADWSKSRRWW
jgi:hypothetical protein